jgi:hypothetical protein
MARLCLALADPTRLMEKNSGKTVFLKQTSFPSGNIFQYFFYLNSPGFLIERAKEQNHIRVRVQRIETRNVYTFTDRIGGIEDSDFSHSPDK